MEVSKAKVNTADAHKALHSAFKEKGFFLAGSAYADRYAKDLEGDLSDRELFVYNRGIKEDGSFSGKSNYNIMVVRTRDALRVSMSNPDESPAATNFGFKELIVRLKYSPGKDCGAFVSNVINATMAYSALKPELTYRFYTHNHLSEIGGEELNVARNMRDDGKASDRVFLANLLLFNADGVAVTCHNNFPEKGWRVFAGEALKYGISVIPGIEATLPLSEFDSRLGSTYGDLPSPNGPHVVLLFESPELASSFWQQHLSKRKFAYAPSASQNVELLKLFDTIDRDYPRQIARLLAHPACDVGLPDLGIVDRLAKGEISVEEMIGIIRRSQGIGFFNPLVGKTPLDLDKYERQVMDCRHFSDDEKTRRISNIDGAKRYLSGILLRHRLGSVLSPNNINIALAKEFPALGYMDTDAHDSDPLYTRVGGAFVWGKWFSLAGGYNRVRFKDAPLARPDAKWAVRYFFGKHACEVEEAKPKVFYVIDNNGVSDVAPGRKEVPFLQKAFNLLQAFYYYTHKQGIVLASETIKGLMKKGTPMGIELARGSIPPNEIFHS